MIPSLLLAHVLPRGRRRSPAMPSSYLLMNIELSEYLCRVEKMLIVKDSSLLSAIFLLAAVQQRSLLCVVCE